MISLEVDREFYQDLEESESCDVHHGCGQIVGGTSALETEALKDFYSEMQGLYWRIQHNWNVGDPCLNLWYGVTCNTKH